MRTRSRRVGGVVAALAAVVGVCAAGAAEAQAACGVEGSISVTRNGDGSRYVRGGGNAFCNPPVSSNLISVNVAPQNVLVNAVMAGGTHSQSASCNNGACSITPISWGYTVPASALAELINGSTRICFTAQYTALSGGGLSRTACG